MTSTIRAVPPKSQAALAREWDAMAEVRDREVETGTDISFNRVLLPTLLGLLPQNAEQILDVGCGTGLLAERLLVSDHQVVGVDPSRVSIERARARGLAPRASFLQATVEEYASGKGDDSNRFDAAIANMSLMTAVDLFGAVAATASLLGPKSVFLFSVTHPWFWPDYWGYANAPWFHYEAEIFIEAPFKISHDAPGILTTHIHRPLTMYWEALHRAGLVVDVLREPRPSSRDEDLYPSRWRFPRFLIVRATKDESQ